MGPDKRDSREAGSEKYFRQKKAVPEEIVPLSYTMVKETTAYADVRGRFLLLYKN